MRCRPPTAGLDAGPPPGQLEETLGTPGTLGLPSSGVDLGRGRVSRQGGGTCSGPRDVGQLRRQGPLPPTHKWGNRSMAPLLWEPEPGAPHRNQQDRGEDQATRGRWQAGATRTPLPNTPRLCSAA